MDFETQFAVLVSVGIAAFVALLNHATVCSERHECIRRGTCYSLNSGSWYDISCSFRTTVTPAGYALLNLSAQYDTMQSMNRGVCSPGLRQQVDMETGDLTCVRKRVYPVALNEEIGDPSASTDHERYCGKWIHAGSITYGSQKWAFFDDGATADAVDEVIRAKGAARLATNDLAKFRAECRTMVAANSAGAAAKQAYGILLPSLETQVLGEALQTVGLLASHYCEAPALVGVANRDNKFVAKVSPGTALPASDLKAAMYVAGESRAVRDLAHEYAHHMQAQQSSTVPELTEAQAQLVVLGSHKGTYIDGYIGPSFQIAFDTANAPLARFIRAFEDLGPAKALAYLKGVAAVCALSARSVVTTEEGNIVPAVWSGSMPPPRAPTAAALGRLKHSEEDLFLSQSEEVHNASTVTLSSLAAISSATATSAREVCLASAKRVFPDEFDRITFNALVTPSLYARLQPMIGAIRQAVEVTLTEDLIGRVFDEYADRSAAVSKVSAARVRIAGAPRGSWAGPQREFRGPDLEASDGAISIVLKQARAVFLDRMLPVVSDMDICEHPALYDALARNAYLLLGSTSACVMLLPGLLVPPFADERYDDASLYTRAGFVVAHEMMHVTAFQAQWDLAYTDPLLSAYRTETRVEAIADVGAATALLRLPFVTNETMCASISQLFCGRIGWAKRWNEPVLAHPATNLRGDNVCAYLRRYF